jgi:hypothetical protein
LAHAAGSRDCHRRRFHRRQRQRSVLRYPARLRDAANLAEVTRPCAVRPGNGEKAWGKKKPRGVFRPRGVLSLNSAAPKAGVCEHVRLPRVRGGASGFILRKEVIQPQVPLRLPCYDLVPIRKSGVGACEGDFGRPSLSWLDGRCVQGSGTHSPRCC